MRTILIGLAALLVFVAPAAAVSVTDCSSDEATASTVNIAEPWEKNSKAFYNGNVRVALIDTGGEPACCSVHLLVLSPAGGQDEPEYRACHLINDHEGMGFVGIDFAKIAASYDAKKGLLITFPFGLYNDGDKPAKPGIAKIRVNTAKGTVVVEK
ncbi:MAG TPA: hypothetical protein VNU97_11950 [Rhizomicrobium sp.]|jgi:hypothetical protein|nr:hypothetical protein [Rhizomicrobium sp.]